MTLVMASLGVLIGGFVGFVVDKALARRDVLDPGGWTFITAICGVAVCGLTIKCFGYSGLSCFLCLIMPPVTSVALTGMAVVACIGCCWLARNLKKVPRVVCRFTTHCIDEVSWHLDRLFPQNNGQVEQ
jgi:hypothetical protein